MNPMSPFTGGEYAAIKTEPEGTSPGIGWVAIGCIMATRDDTSQNSQYVNGRYVYPQIPCLQIVWGKTKDQAYIEMQEHEAAARAAQYNAESALRDEQRKNSDLADKLKRCERDLTDEKAWDASTSTQLTKAYEELTAARKHNQLIKRRDAKIRAILERDEKKKE